MLVSKNDVGCVSCDTLFDSFCYSVCCGHPMTTGPVGDRMNGKNNYYITTTTHTN